MMQYGQNHFVNQLIRVIDLVLVKWFFVMASTTRHSNNVTLASYLCMFSFFRSFRMMMTLSACTQFDAQPLLIAFEEF